jgi:dTDP-4-amino-4,6-dideoxygalactose transaminase
MAQHPVSEVRIFLSPPHPSGTEVGYLQKSIAHGWGCSSATEVDHFESELSDYIGGSHVAGLNTGTAAIHLALILLKLHPGDEVLCQSFTFAATVNPVLYQGALPVFVDSETLTWNMDPLLLEQTIQERLKKGKRPKACIVVHSYGMPAQIHRIRQICYNAEIPLIEDAAEALGSDIQGQKLGTFGNFGIFSFNRNKIITTAGGGALLSSESEGIQKARFLSTQSKDPAPYYQHTQIGYNYRMSDVSAAIGRAQLEVVETRIRQRRSNFDFYRRNIRCEWLSEPEGYHSNRWLSCALFSSHEEREQVRLLLNRHSIESRPLWKPLHRQPAYSEYPHSTNGTSDDLFERGLCFPSGSNLSVEDLQRVAHIVNQR